MKKPQQQEQKAGAGQPAGAPAAERRSWRQRAKRWPRRMALARREGKKLSRRQLIIIEGVVFLLVVSVFVVKATNYFGIEALQPANIVARTEAGYDNLAEHIRQSKLIGRCPAGTRKIADGWSYVCRAAAAPSPLVNIFDTYPKIAGGREYVYSSTNSGNLQTAKDLALKNQYDFSRYKPVVITKNTWQEDPYNDRYWRFDYYSLSMVDDLVYAFDRTGDRQYADKAAQIVNSFVEHGMAQPQAWSDNHAVAFRTMTLVNFWWKLRQHDALDITTSNNVLAALQQHGAFLADRSHFQPNHNHGVNEAAALYLLARAFPTLSPSSDGWRELAASRLDTVLQGLVDADGALVEDSPYYHFYTFEKFWQIYEYGQKWHDPISQGFKPKLDKMANYATYILEPDQHVPTIGASLDQRVFDSGVMADIANHYPQLKYVLTRGAHGSAPAKDGFFDATGEAMLRSDFGKRTFNRQTQVVFQATGYHTGHSHLDALSFVLTKGDTPMFVDPGLYTYDSDPVSAWFRGTAAHNTVDVDGQDQQRGPASITHQETAAKYSSVSGADQLFTGVNSSRSIALLDQNTVIIVDKLTSQSQHTYTQNFHLAPGAAVRQLSDQEVQATFAGSKQPVLIRQLQPVASGKTTVLSTQQRSGQIGGLCSKQYGKLLTCPQVSFSQQAANGYFVTAIELDGAQRQYHVSGSQLQVKIGRDTFTVNLQSSPAKDRLVQGVTTSRPALPPATKIDDGLWQVSNGTLQSSDQNGDKIYTLRPAESGLSATATQAVSLDLTHRSISLRMRVQNLADLQNLSLQLSNNNWSRRVEHALTQTYYASLNGDWLTVNFAPDLANATSAQQWLQRGSGTFDWAHIDGVRLSIGGKPDTSVDFADISTLPVSGSPRVVIVIDDGAESADYAVPILTKYGQKANIAAIGKYIDHYQAGYLTASELRKIHEQYGWDIVNHTYYHQPAVADYAETGKLDAYAGDILDGAITLQRNGIDTNDNWFVYPDGSFNTAVESIVGKYYRFARTQAAGPQVAPFADPLAVMAFPVNDDTPVQAVEQAVDNALASNQTLFLTFHRFKTTDDPNTVGYTTQNLAAIASYLASRGVHAMSLTQLDTSMGVPPSHPVFKPATPAATTMRVQLSTTQLWQRIFGGSKQGKK